MKTIEIKKSINTISIFKEIEKVLNSVKNINLECEENEDLFIYFDLDKKLKIITDNGTYICNQIMKSFYSSNYKFDIDNFTLSCDIFFYELVVENNKEEGSIYLTINKNNENEYKIKIDFDIYEKD